ncbi:MAG TPA: NAD-dependent deacylase [Thermodesulfobacteriota bacterium]|nr:NAD-dependent deacylase [Thermodesulfobacteriota bacterium]
MDKESLDKAIELVENANIVAVLTGAGISEESGIPTFRDEGGLWKEHRPQDIATPEAFARDPQFVWEWYDLRRQTIIEAEPNPGHFALVELENKKEGFTLITQNIDGLHKKAGNKSMIEMHGNIWQMRCTKCGHIYHDYEVPLKQIPPSCEKCGEMTRPNVVWFGEIIPMSAIDACVIAIDKCDVMLIIGTSGVVEPAASMGLMAMRSGKKVIEINLDTTPGTGMYDISLKGKSGEILPEFYKHTTEYN